MATINIEANLAGSSEAVAAPVRKIQMSATLHGTSAGYQFRGRQQQAVVVADAAFMLDVPQGDDRE